MIKTSETTHVLNLIPDYVLELLPPAESDRVAHHLARCQECHQAMASERELSRSVQRTLRAVSAPDRAKLRQLIPASPARPKWTASQLFLSPGWAAVGLLLLVAFGAIGLYLNQQPVSWTFEQPTVGSTAVLLTDTPTQTATRNIAATVDFEALAPGSAASPPTSVQHVAPEIRPVLAPVPAAVLYH